MKFCITILRRFFLVVLTQFKVFLASRLPTCCTRFHVIAYLTGICIIYLVFVHHKKNICILFYSIKAKINGLRAQLGREVAKVNKTKSGQSTDGLYASSWIHYDRLSFLLPVIKSSKSKDTLKRKNEEENEEVEETRFSTPGLKKKAIAERKIELLSKCTEAITKKPVESADSKHSAFALYVDEKLSQSGKRHRKNPEKRISDVLFEVEMQSERAYESSNDVWELWK